MINQNDRLPKPSLNGLMIERKLGFENTNKELIDDIENKIEIKSCEEWTKDFKKGELIRRRGRFKFFKLQHEFLTYLDGYYLLVVHNTGEIKYQKMIKARDLEFKISINWKRLF